ncbi:MAG: TolC family protein [Calditrichaeota bacterium]|nr:TolC family protein [Calditrichota bacterium]
MNVKKIALVLVIGSFIGTGVLFAQQEKTDSRTELQQLIQLALKKNPGLRAKALLVESVRTRIPQAGALPDPLLSISLMNMPINSFSFDQEPMTGKQVALMQKIPFPGKLGLKQSIAESSFEVEKFRKKEYENQLIGAIKKTYFSLFAVDQVLRVTEKNLQLLQEFIRIAETRYSVGKGLQQDVLKAQVEHSKLLDQQITLRQRRRSLQAKLNSLVNRSVDTTIPEISTLHLDSLHLEPPELEKIAFESRPFLHALQTRIQKSQQAVRLAQKGFFPDFSLGVAYTQRNRLRNGMAGIDYVSAVISINLPVYFAKKQSQKVSEMRAKKTEAEETFQNTLNMIRFQIEDAWSRVQKNKRQLELLNTGILPQASQSLDAALAGYQVGKIDFLTLLNNQRTLFMYESQYYQALAAYEKSLADLEVIVGKPLLDEQSER